jgi:HK97 family phage prohead protease
VTVLAPTSPARPPRDGLVRALRPGLEFRAANEGDKPTLFGHFAVFNRFTEIDSWFEGNFLERIAPGAFKKTFKEQRNSMRVLLQHGRDPEIGDKPIAAINVLREDTEGAYYEAELFDGLPQLVVDGLRADQYGASFRFRVVREEYNEDPGTSGDNPKGLPERTIKEMQVFEFGPVTFPAYSEASAGVRSLTDAYFFGRLASTPPEELRSLFMEGRDLAPGNTSVTIVTNEVTDDESDEDSTEVRTESDDAADETREADTTSVEDKVEDKPEAKTKDAPETRADDNQETAVPGKPTPLNTIAPRSKRGKPWELPSSTTLRSTRRGV